MEVIIDYRPRPAQRRIHEMLDGHRFVVIVAHRRMGKTVAVINHIIKRAIVDRKPRAFYGYVAPFRNQAKSIAWDYLKYFTSPFPGREVAEQELSVTLPNRAKIRIFGADNADSLRGLYFDGAVLDEVAQMKPEVWGEIIRPALADRLGWAVFIGTPKGVNLFHDLYLRASKDPSGDWAALSLPIHETMKDPDPPLAADEVERLKAESSDNAWRQEFLCDFTASADNVLIPVDLAVAAAGRKITEREIRGAPLVVGVDVARFGSDSSVFLRRAGLASFPPVILRGLDNQAVAERLVSHYHEHQPAAIFIDAGQGQGVIDFANKLIPNVVEVPFAGRAVSDGKFVNRRSEMWYAMREWLNAGGAVPDDSRLIKELSTPMYFYNAAGKIQLEAKEKIVERMGFSPDIADALALTFAQPVMPAALAMNLPRQAVQRSSLY